MARISMHVDNCDKPSYNNLGSPEQVAIWNALDTGGNNLIVNAVAGSGKTWTIVEWAKRLTSGRTALVAFNKHIATELKTRLGDNRYVESMTYHSLGFRQVKTVAPRAQVDQYKVDGILDNITLPIADDWQNKNAKYKIKRLVSLAKQYAMRGRADLEILVDWHDIELNGNEEVIYEYVPKVLDECKANLASVDFDDMVWLPSELKLSSKQYDTMCVDELQDTNIVQQWLALHSADRIIGVGDKFQSIYSFRGADSESMARFTKALATSPRNVLELPLTVTRRCPKLHVSLAQRIVPHITALDTASVGHVEAVKTEKAIDDMRLGDLVLCRVNADLLGVAYKLLKRGVKAVVRGRDIGAGLDKLIDHAIKAGSDQQVKSVLSVAGEITQREIDKYLAIPHGRGEMRAGSCADRYSCLCELSDGSNTVDELKDVIRRLFADFDDSGKPNSAVVLGTVHRTKGLEADRVFVLRGDLIPHPMAKQPWEQQQELNLAYVAVTRSKDSLIWCGQSSGLFS